MWCPTKDANYGIAIHNFDGRVKGGLSLYVGDTVQIIEQCPGWFRGFCIRNKALKSDGRYCLVTVTSSTGLAVISQLKYNYSQLMSRINQGIFPTGYIHLKECHVDAVGPDPTVTPVEDNTVKEVSYVLREWSIIWKKLYKDGHRSSFHFLRQVMSSLFEDRKRLMSGTLTHDQMLELKIKLSEAIDIGNRKLGLDMVPRHEGVEQVDGDKISPVELFRIHEKGSEMLDAGTTTGTLRVRKQKQKLFTHHLYLMLSRFNCNVGEDTEVHFALYDSKTAKFFSEKFVIKLGKNGVPLERNVVSYTGGLFTDLGNTDLDRDTYLVAHIYRIAGLDNDSKKPSTIQYRRPYGCAAKSIKDVLTGNDEAQDEQLSMKIYCCSENDFPQVHENIIRRTSSKLTLSSATNNFALVVNIKVLHGDLEVVKKEFPVMIRDVIIIKKLGFSDVIMPATVRNDLYITLMRGELDKGSKNAALNVEVKVMIVDDQGTLIKDCISPSSGEANVTEHRSVIFYHQNCPRWNDTVKAIIPVEVFPQCHIRIEFRHCSTKYKAEKRLFGFSFIRLEGDDRTTLTNGIHELFVYKCDQASKISSADAYIGLPGSQEELNPALGTTQGNVFFRRSEKEVVFIETLLCSTKLTQNADLLGFLRWKMHPQKLEKNIVKLIQLDGEEVVKHLQDILDALFDIFTYRKRISQSQQNLAFKALVHMFYLLENPKFEHFLSLMDVYIAEHFSDSLAYRDLLICLKLMLEKTVIGSHEIHTQCFQVLEWIMKCVVQSRILLVRAVENPEDDDFKQLLQDVTDRIYRVLSFNTEEILTVQTLLLKQLPGMLIQLSRVMASADLSHIFRHLLSALPLTHAVRLNSVTLDATIQIINSDIFKSTVSKSLMLPLCTDQIRQCLLNLQDLSQCIQMLGDIMISLHRDKQQDSEVDSHVSVILVSLLDVVVHKVLEGDLHPNLQRPLVATMIGMLKVMEEKHYTTLVTKIPDIQRVKEFVQRMLSLFQKMLKHNVFPEDWMVMKMVANHVILLTVQYLSQTMTKTFLKEYAFDRKLWNEYFTLSVIFLTQPCLQLEQFSEARRQKILERYGDMRVRMGYEILSMWQILEDHKSDFVPQMVGTFLEVTLVPEVELREATLPIFFDMMKCDQNKFDNFKQVETELIDRLDILISDKKGDDEYKRLFNTMEYLTSVLLEKVQSEPEWRESGTAFIQSVTRLLERLLDYRNVLEGDENRQKKMTCTVNLLNFYKNEINRQEMYVRYIYKLCDLHLACENYTEAGFTLLLHAQLLGWTDTALSAEIDSEPQLEWQRKEELYLKILRHFDKGKGWEYGIPLCKELAELYETKIEYSKLSQILKTQATFYDNILTKLRPHASYYKVGFFGEGFPLFLRGKEFVYRGDALEKMTSFRQRMQMEFPGATIPVPGTTPTDSLRHGDAQCIEICAVTPLREDRATMNSPNVPKLVKDFYKFNEVDQFQFERPFHRPHKDEHNEFKTLWKERTIVRTSSKLPGILRWFEVVQRKTVQLCPISTAIESVDEMNRDIRLIKHQVAHDSSKNLNSLTMRLKGTISADVNGGMALYQEAFLTPQFAQENPNMSGKVEQLKALFIEQVQVLDQALELHGKVISEQIQPLHQDLVRNFKKMKQNLKACGSPNMVRLLSASEKLTKDPFREKRDSTHSTASSKSSASSAYTTTPPDSKRSSGVFSYCDSTMEADRDSISDDVSTLRDSSQTNSVAGFGLLSTCNSVISNGGPVPAPTSRTLDNGAVLRVNHKANCKSVQRPLSAVYPRTAELALTQDSRKAHDGTSTNSKLSHHASSVSLDSAIGDPHCSGNRFDSPTRKTESGPPSASRKSDLRRSDHAPPKLPPRKHSYEASSSSTSPESPSHPGSDQHAPTVPHRTHKPSYSRTGSTPSRKTPETTEPSTLPDVVKDGNPMLFEFHVPPPTPRTPVVHQETTAAHRTPIDTRAHVRTTAPQNYINVTLSSADNPPPIPNRTPTSRRPPPIPNPRTPLREKPTIKH